MRSYLYTNPNGLTITLGPAPYFVEKTEGIETPEWENLETKAPLQDGTTDIGGNFAPRDITIEGALSAVPNDIVGITTSRRLMIQALNPKDGVGTLDYTNDAGVWRINAKPVGSPVFAPREAGEPYQRFMVTFRAADPHWMDVTATSETLTGEGSGLAIPAAGIGIPVGGLAVETIATINGKSIIVENAGDVECPILIRFYGETINPKITNVTTGEYIRIVKTIAVGDYVEVNTAFGSKTVIISESGSITNATMYLDLLSTFFQLAPGNNEIKFTDEGAAVGSSAVITYRNRYIGV